MKSQSLLQNLPAHEPCETRVQFSDDEASGGVVVACETSHPGGLIAPLVKRLSDLKLEVHQIESRLQSGMRFERLHVAAADGKPLSQQRQALLQAAVFQSMDVVRQTCVPVAAPVDGSALRRAATARRSARSEAPLGAPVALSQAPVSLTSQQLAELRASWSAPPS